MGTVSNIRDGLMNMVSRLGTRSDKAAANTYVLPPPDRAEIDAAYRTSWFRKIVEAVPFDEVREWRTWQADVTTETTPIEAEENRLNIRAKIYSARVLARKDGGALIYLGGLPGASDTPLNVDLVKKGGLRSATVLTRYEVTVRQRELDIESDNYGNPTMYVLNGENGTIDIHPSRVIRFVGSDKGNVFEWDGWGDSLWVVLRDAIRNSDSAAAGVASLIQEAKIDVISIPGLMQKIATTEYETRLTTRLQVANLLKSINNVLLIDGGDSEGKGGETFEQKTLTFAGIPDIMDRLDIKMAGMAKIPSTKLLGRTPAGMNATGESDMRNYYDDVSAARELELTPLMHTMDELLIRSALGIRPPDIYYEWNPLWQTSAVENATIEKTLADALTARINTGIFDDAVLAKGEMAGMVERGQYPGLQNAIAESPEDDGVKDPEEVAALEAMQAKADLAAKNPIIKDAAPRTLYVRRDVVNVAEIRKWATAQGFTDIVPDLHVTIAYSRTPVDWFSVGQSWSPKLEIPAGGPRQMDALGPDKKYMALLITASELVWRNKEIIEAGATWDWPEYQPHVSIQIGGNVDLSKVEPYQGKIVLGPEMFEEVRTK